MTRKTTIFVSLGLAVFTVLSVMFGARFFLNLLYDHHDRIAPGGLWKSMVWTHISPSGEVVKLMDLSLAIAFVPLCVGLGTLARRNFSARWRYGHDFVRAWLIAICATPLAIGLWTFGLLSFYGGHVDVAIDTLDGLDALGLKTVLYALGCAIVVLGMIGGSFGGEVLSSE